jgi:hypothetical protein
MILDPKSKNDHLYFLFFYFFGSKIIYATLRMCTWLRSSSAVRQEQLHVVSRGWLAGRLSHIRVKGRGWQPA